MKNTIEKIVSSVISMSATQLRLAVLGVLAGYAIIITIFLTALGIALPANFAGNMVAMGAMIAIVAPDLRKFYQNASPTAVSLSFVFVLIGLAIFNLGLPYFMAMAMSLTVFVISDKAQKTSRALTVRADGKPVTKGQMKYLRRRAAKGKL